MYHFQTALPEQAGIPSQSVINIMEELKQKQIPMHSFLLWKNNLLITEGYYAPCRKQEPHRLFSVTKSFVSVAIGVLCDRGLLSLDDPIIRYFPEYLPETVHPWLSQTTIRDMLMMRSCHASTTYKHDLHKNWVESFFTVPPTHKPGTVFHYDTSASHTLCALAEKLSGKKLLDFLRDVCLDELGFSKEAFILEDPFGTSMGGSGLVATSRDFLLFALLIARCGTLDGKEYLPSWYLKEATAFHTATCVAGPIPGECQGYGYQFWRGEHGTIILYGMGGQLAVILPEYDCVCVTTADTQGYGGGNQVIYDAIYRHLLPVLASAGSGDRQTGNSPAFDTTLLSEYLKTLEISPLDCPSASMSSPRIAEINSQCYLIQTPDSPPAAVNSHPFRNVSFQFTDKQTGTFSYTTDKGTMLLPFGFGLLMEGRFPGYHMKCASSAVWLSDSCLYIKVHLLDTSVGSVHIQAYFGDKDVTLFLRKQEETMFQEFSGHLYGVSSSSAACGSGTH